MCIKYEVCVIKQVARRLPTDNNDNADNDEKSMAA